MFAILRPRLGRGLKREESLKLMFQRKVGWHYSMPTFLINPACSSISIFYLKSIFFRYACISRRALCPTHSLTDSQIDGFSKHLISPFSLAQQWHIALLCTYWVVKYR